MITFKAEKLNKALDMAEHHNHPRGGHVVRRDGHWWFTPRGQKTIKLSE